MPALQESGFLDKPPLTFWIMAASFGLFGINLVAEGLPAALAGLATAAFLGFWALGAPVSSRPSRGPDPGAFPLLSTVSLTFAADAFLTLALVIAALAVDGAGAPPGRTGPPMGHSLRSGPRVRVLLQGTHRRRPPRGRGRRGLALDRIWPLRPVRRVLWTVPESSRPRRTLALGDGAAPRIRVLAPALLEEPVPAGSTRIFMAPSRGLLDYVGILAWGAFPWSLHSPGASAPPALQCVSRVVRVWPRGPEPPRDEARGLPGDVFRPRRPLGGGARRGPTYARRSGGAPHGPRRRRRRGRARGPRSGSPALAGDLRFRLGGWRSRSGLAVLTAALVAAAVAPCTPARAVRRGPGLRRLLLPSGLRGRLDRSTPCRVGGARAQGVRSGCDGFLVGNNYNSVDFYSRSDWLPVQEGLSGVPGRLRHPKGFVLMWSRASRSSRGCR